MSLFRFSFQENAQEQIPAGNAAIEMDYKQQAVLTKELGRLQGVLSNLSVLTALQTEVADLSSVESESKQDPELRQMALQERKLLEDQVQYCKCMRTLTRYYPILALYYHHNLKKEHLLAVRCNLMVVHSASFQGFIQAVM